MNYTQVYQDYLDTLISCRNNNTPSVMYPPNFNGDLVLNLPKNTATVVFTTGTTGKPKGVVHDFESINNSIKINTEILNINSEDILLNFLPTWTIGTYIYTFPTHLKEGKILHNKFSVEVFKDYLKCKPTTTLLIPTMIDMLIESGIDFDLSTFRNIGTGAEEVQLRHLEYLLEKGAKSVTHIYGSSEATPIVLYNTFYNVKDITLGLKEVETFTYNNKESLLISGISVANSYNNLDLIEVYDSNDHFLIKDSLYFWQNRTDNIVKKKGWKEVVEREFTVIEKEFTSELDPTKLIWHRDIGDREVTILNTGGNWKFEADGRTPRTLLQGDVLYVPKTTLHKIHKGNGNLKVSIKEFK